MKSRVETRHLGQFRESMMKCLSQQDLLRQMVGIEWTEPVQLLNHLRGDPLWLVIPWSAVHHAMSHRSQCLTTAALLDPIHQSGHGHRVIRRSH